MTNFVRNMLDQMVRVFVILIPLYDLQCEQCSPSIHPSVIDSLMIVLLCGCVCVCLCFFAEMEGNGI